MKHSLSLIVFVFAFFLPLQARATYCIEDASFSKPPLAEDAYEQKVFGVLEDILKNQAFQNVPLEDARFMRLLAETTGAKNIVEIGTSTGYSAIWFGLALKKTGGKLTTFEIDAERAALARKNFERAEMAEIITLIEGDAHENVLQLKEPIDLLFLDADKEGYIDYFEKLKHLVRPGGLIIGDNIMKGMADPRFLKAIQQDPAFETVIRGSVSYTYRRPEPQKKAGNMAPQEGFEPPTK